MKPRPVQSSAEIADRMRRSKKRSKYHELALLKFLKRLGWRSNEEWVSRFHKYLDEEDFERLGHFDFAGRRIPVSGPMFGWCDNFATKVVRDKLHIAFFQVKPRAEYEYCYFDKKQLLSLFMLAELFEAPNVAVHKILAGRLKRKWVFHKVTETDLQLLVEQTLRYKRPALYRLDKSKADWSPRVKS
jgi:hypothetical protein